MMKLRDFLKVKLREQMSPERRERRQEWIAALERLRDQLAHWLREADPEGFLGISPVEREIWEPQLGRYRAPALTVAVGAEEEVRIIPRGRDSHGSIERGGQPAIPPAGIVEITAGIRRVRLFRYLADSKETWYVIDEDYRARELTQEAFEQLVLELLA